MFLHRYLTVIIATLSLVAGSPSASADELEDILQTGIKRLLCRRTSRRLAQSAKTANVSDGKVDLDEHVDAGLGTVPAKAAA